MKINKIKKHLRKYVASYTYLILLTSFLIQGRYNSGILMLLTGLTLLAYNEQFAEYSDPDKGHDLSNPVTSETTTDKPH